MEMCIRDRISFVKNCGIIKLSVKKANCIDNTGVKGCNAMKEITKETLLKDVYKRPRLCYLW